MGEILIPISEAFGISILITLIILHALNHGQEDFEEDDEDGQNRN